MISQILMLIQNLRGIHLTLFGGKIMFLNFKLKRDLKVPDVTSKTGLQKVTKISSTGLSHLGIYSHI